MPVTYDELADFSTAALSDDEALFVRVPVLWEESTVAVPSASDITTALAALDGAGLRQIRAHIARYRAGQALIDGGPDAVTLDPVIVRWGVRNGVRLLLGFDAEPRPYGSSNALQYFSLPVESSACDSEF